MSLQRPSIRYGTQVLFGIVLLLLLAWPIWASPLQQSCATLAFDPRTVWDAQVGDIVILQVLLDADGVTFDAVGLWINFDQTLLQVVDAAGDPAIEIEPGDLPGTIFKNEALNAAGTIDFTQAILPPAPTQTGGNFTVATIRLKVIAALPAGGTPVAFVGFEDDDTGVFEAGPPNLLCESPGPATITSAPPPEPVGGYVVQMNKLELVAPWIGLVALASLAALTVVLVRRRRG